MLSEQKGGQGGPRGAPFRGGPPMQGLCSLWPISINKQQLSFLDLETTVDLELVGGYS